MRVRGSKVTALPHGLGGLGPLPFEQMHGRVRSLAPSHTVPCGSVCRPGHRSWTQRGKERASRTDMSELGPGGPEGRIPAERHSKGTARIQKGAGTAPEGQPPAA